MENILSLFWCFEQSAIIIVSNDSDLNSTVMENSQFFAVVAK